MPIPFLTLVPSMTWVSMTIVAASCSHTMRQKSPIVLGSGPGEGRGMGRERGRERGRVREDMRGEVRGGKWHRGEEQVCYSTNMTSI